MNKTIYIASLLSFFYFDSTAGALSKKSETYFYGFKNTVSLLGKIQKVNKKEKKFILILEDSINVISDPKEKIVVDPAEKNIHNLTLLLPTSNKLDLILEKKVLVTGYLEHDFDSSGILLSVDKIEDANWLQEKTIQTYYDPEVTTLEGTLSLETFPGRPNYENIKTGDEAETYWILNLAHPITVSVKAGQKDDYKDPETRVRWVQLVMDYQKIIPKKLGFQAGKNIKVTGTLFHAQTGHHHTDILIDVQKIH